MDLNISKAISKLSSFISHESPETRNSSLKYRDSIKVEDKFLNRLHSFSLTEWYGRPLWLSPIRCASHGWVYIGEGILQCQSCANKIGGKMDPNLDIHAANLTFKRLENLLVYGHSAWCIWKSCSVPDKFLRINIQEEVQHNFIVRLKSLLNINTIPLISKNFILDIDEEKCNQILKDFLVLDSKNYSQKKMFSLISLALCGWFVSETNREVLLCKFCKRSMGLWNYKTCENFINTTEINADINLINLRNSEEINFTEEEVCIQQSLEDDSPKSCINDYSNLLNESLNEFNTGNNLSSLINEAHEDKFNYQKINNLNEFTTDVNHKNVCSTVLDKNECSAVYNENVCYTVNDLEEGRCNLINENLNDIGGGDIKIKNLRVDEVILNAPGCKSDGVVGDDISAEKKFAANDETNFSTIDCDVSKVFHNGDDNSLCKSDNANESADQGNLLTGDSIALIDGNSMTKVDDACVANELADEVNRGKLLLSDCSALNDNYSLSKADTHVSHELVDEVNRGNLLIDSSKASSNNDNSLSKADNTTTESVLPSSDIVSLNVAANTLKRHLDCLHDSLQLEFKKPKLESITKMALHPVSEHEPWCIWVGKTRQLCNKINNENHFVNSSLAFIDGNLAVGHSDNVATKELDNTDVPYLQLMKLIFYPVDLLALNNEKRIVEVHRIKNLLNL